MKNAVPQTGKVSVIFILYFSDTLDLFEDYLIGSHCEVSPKSKPCLMLDFFLFFFPPDQVLPELCHVVQVFKFDVVDDNSMLYFPFIILR